MKSLPSLLLIGCSIAFDASANTDLFHIKRNKNRNEFHYEGLVTADCQWQERATHGYWRMLEKGRDVRAKMALWERGAYGHDVSKATPRRIEVQLKAKPDLPVTVELRDVNGTCEAVSTTRINGERSRLRFVYVCAKEGALMFPRIQYVEVHGFDHEGKPVVERFPRTEWARKLPNALPLGADADPPMGSPNCGHQ